MISTQTGPARYYANIEGMDPRADWLFGPGQQDYLPHGADMLIPFIINLQDKAGFDFVKDRFLRLGAPSPIFVPPLYAGKLRAGRLAGEYFVAIATKAFFDELAKPDGMFETLRTARKEIRLGAPLRTPNLVNFDWKPNKPIPEAAGPPVGPPAVAWPPDTVVVGVIDDGIGFAHARFRDKAGKSRVECFWRMDPPDTAPLSLAYGSEIVKGGANGIDDLLQKSSNATGAVDEDWVYRAAGLIDFAMPEHKSAAWRIAHGTCVLDLAAGEDPADDVKNRPIIAVQLRAATTQDTSGGDLYADVVLAVDYILARADALASPGQLPVVINFSYGLLAGPHDGTSEIERFLNQRILERAGKLQIILPAGNSHLSRCHAEVRFTPQVPEIDLYWRVQPDDQTPSFLEIWLPHAGAAPATDRVRLSVLAPEGAGVSSLLRETDVLPVVVMNDGEVVCAAQADFKPSPTERRFFQVTLQPTARPQPTSTPTDAKRIAPPGVWTIRLHNVSLASHEPLQAWIQRDDAPHSYPIRGRQSYFDDPCYVRFTARGREIEEDSHPEQVASPSAVKRAGSVNGIATGAEAIVAGGYRRKELCLARYSAGEPITPTRNQVLSPSFRKPDAALVSEESKVHAGVLAAGSHSGARLPINGTSVAAPQLARWVADQLAQGNPGDRNAVKATASADDPDPASLPPERGGWGRMQIEPKLFPHKRYD